MKPNRVGSAAERRRSPSRSAFSQVASKSLSQSSADVREHGSQVSDFALAAQRRVFFPPPSQKPFGIDRGNRPPGESAEQASPGNCERVRVTGVARQSSRRNADGYR